VEKTKYVELDDLYISPNSVLVTKSRGIRRAEQKTIIYNPKMSDALEYVCERIRWELCFSFGF